MSPQDLLTASSVILDSLSDGVYVCDTDRRIVYWSKAAEKITGWGRDDVIGRRCLDDVLCHIDKDGHRLCGEEFCPLQIREGDSVLLFSDGVFEVHNAQGEMLGIDGLIGIIKSLGYPDAAIEPKALEEELLKYSNAIRLDDDVTLIEMRM